MFMFLFGLSQKADKKAVQKFVSTIITPWNGWKTILQMPVWEGKARRKQDSCIYKMTKNIIYLFLVWQNYSIKHLSIYMHATVDIMCTNCEM